MATLNFTNEPAPADTDKLVGFRTAVPGGERTFSLSALKTFFTADLSVLLVRRTSVAGAEATSLANVVVTAASEGTVLKVAGAADSYPSVTYNEEWTLYEDPAAASVAGVSQLCFGYDADDLPFVWIKTA